MSNIEELDDFELAIHEKLASFELTPPVGSWNAIVNSQSTESRRMKIVWFNKSSFFVVFLSSMFSMWLAFGSIDFNLNNYNSSDKKLLEEINNERLVVSSGINERDFANHKIKNSNTGLDIFLDNNRIEKGSELIASSLENIGIEDQSEIIIVEPNNQMTYLNALDVSPKEGNIEELVLSDYTIDQVRVKIKATPRINLFVKAESMALINNELLSEVTALKLSNGKTIQLNNKFGLELTYSLNSKVKFGLGLGITNIYQINKYLQTIENKYTVLDSTIIGYIQDPVTGRTPVYDIKERNVNEIQEKDLSFINNINALELPIKIDWIVLRKNRLNVSINAGANLTHIFSKNYKTLTNEGLNINSFTFKSNLFSTTTGIEMNYLLNNNFSAYVQTNYLNVKSDVIKSGVQYGLGLKYKFY